jgi:L-amino acid N-acyltransferase YncA
VLRDGRTVTIRAVQPSDADAFRAAFARLSPETRYKRMMGSVRELSETLLQKAVSPVDGRELALVAIAGEDGSIVGGARYVVDAAGESCEFAVAISDEWQRVGLASYLLQALIVRARERRLKSMHGYVLSSNSGMLNLATRLGFETTRSDEGPTVRLVRLGLLPA